MSETLTSNGLAHLEDCVQTLSCAFYSPAFPHEDVVDLLSSALTEHWKCGDRITGWSGCEEA